MSAVWQCTCGHIEHTSEFPEDCAECFRVGEFNKVPDDLLEEKAEEQVLSMKPEEEE